jgi:hypothetical protein
MITLGDDSCVGIGTSSPLARLADASYGDASGGERGSVLYGSMLQLALNEAYFARRFNIKRGTGVKLRR